MDGEECDRVWMGRSGGGSVGVNVSQQKCLKISQRNGGGGLNVFGSENVNEVKSRELEA